MSLLDHQNRETLVNKCQKGEIRRGGRKKNKGKEGIEGGRVVGKGDKMRGKEKEEEKHQDRESIKKLMRTKEDCK